MVEMQSMMEDEWECKEKKNEKKRKEKKEKKFQLKNSLV